MMSTFTRPPTRPRLPCREALVWLLALLPVAGCRLPGAALPGFQAPPPPAFAAADPRGAAPAPAPELLPHLPPSPPSAGPPAWGMAEPGRSPANPGVALASLHQDLNASTEPEGESRNRATDDPSPVVVYGDWNPLLWSEDYVIQPGDQLAIKFRYTPDLDEELTVRPDGLISLQLVGDVPAAELTPEQLRQYLIQAYGATLRNPQIVVLVKRFAGNHVYIGGEVEAPGLIPISGRLSALQAIILAGGFKDTANRKRVLLFHKEGHCERLNLHGEIAGTVLGQDPPLQAYDVIFVPKSTIAKVNQFVDQYINKMLPFERSFGIFINRELTAPQP